MSMVALSRQEDSSSTNLKEASRVRDMFSAIADRYDLLNHLLSFNQDRKWRRLLAEAVEFPPHSVLLDICAGTGDLGIELLKRRQEVDRVLAADFSVAMLRLAKRKTQKLGLERQVMLSASDALRLPFREAVFDGVVCAFGVRNFEDTEAGLRELARVTKPKGRILVLEFFPGRSPLLEIPFRLFSKTILPWVGKLISKHRDAYSYLPKSVEGFLTREEMQELLEKVSYSEVNWHDLTFGIATLFTAVRKGEVE